MNEDRGYGAMPKLYGAPSYARPRGAGPETPTRVFDPDDLPLESHRLELDDEQGAEISATAYQPGPRTHASGPDDAREGSAMMRGRPFFLRLPGRSRPDDQG